MLSLIGVCAAVSLGTAIATQGLETLTKRLTLAVKAMGNLSALTEAEKAEVKKMVKDKRSAKELYDKLSPEERERARRTFDSLSEEQKKQYREMYGR